MQVALEESPDLQSISASVRAAGFDTRAARAERLPTVSAVGGGNYSNFLGTLDEAVGVPGAAVDQSQVTSRVGLSATIPLYQGGLVGARVRQSQAVQSRLLEQAVGVERSVVAQTRAAFASYEATLDAIRANEVAVRANELALEGNRAERTVGTRTVLEVLNAEQELLQSRVNLVTARRDNYVAGFQLLNAMGQAELRDLGLDGGPLYDPTLNYRRVTRRSSDSARDPKPEPVARRTGPTDTPLVAPPVTSDRN